MFDFRKIPVVKMKKLVDVFPQIDSIKIGADYFGKHYSNCLLITLNYPRNPKMNGMHIMVSYDPKHQFISHLYRNDDDFASFDSSDNKSITSAVKQSLYGNMSVDY